MSDIEKYEDFLLTLKNNTGRMAAHAMKYHEDVLLGRGTLYQKGKVLEEIGELIQAVAFGRYAKDAPYPEARNSVESEAADVIISTVVLICFIEEFSPAEIFAKRVLTTKHISYKYAAEQSILAVHFGFHSKILYFMYRALAIAGLSPAETVLKRITFNEGL